MAQENEKVPGNLVLVLMAAGLMLARVDRERLTDAGDPIIYLHAPAIVSRMPMPDPMGRLTMTTFCDRLPIKRLVTTMAKISAWEIVEDGSDYARIYAHAPEPESLIRRV